MKHFLDTSVLRPLISSSQKVRNYYETAFEKDNRYISQYIQMEFIRGFLIPLINFYACLQHPNINTVEDAKAYWNESFSSRDIKAVNDLINNLTTADPTIIINQTYFSNRVADYIRRALSSLKSRYKNIGQDGNLCFKMKANLIYDPSDIEQSFVDFATSFSNKDNYKTCGINEFMTRHDNNKEIMIAKKSEKIDNSPNQGFKKIVEALEDDKIITCRKCGKLGDFVIASLCPKDMRLEHTDYSFDYLCHHLNKNHQKHPPKTFIIKETELS